MTLSLDRVNAALGGVYRVEGILGAGGMATVYSARDAKHDRFVAIKVMDPGIAADLPASVFLREIRTTAKFSHPGIIGLIDSGALAIDGEEIPYYVMPRIDGETLRSRLQRGGALPIADAVELTRQVADALAYAHAREVIHRDIKPENILLVGNRALVADFGIAKAIGEASATMQTAEGVVKGTAAYMSPEQVTGDVIGPASDVFSLGVVLYEMLTAELPFAGATPQAQLARRLHETPSPARSRRPTIPRRLDGIVSRMLARYPADRFRSAADVASALAGSLDDAPPRHRAWIGAGVGVALAAGAAVFALRADGVSRTVAAPAVRSIAVLPFAYVGPDARSEYYGEGIADELAGALGRLPGLKVAARSSAFQFKGLNVEAREIGARLGVGAVVEGSVRPVGDRLRIAAQLIGSADGLVIWSVSYERPADQVFDVQATMTDSIARALGVAGRSRPTVAPNHRAYEAYLQGRWHWAKRDREGFQKAVEYFRLAMKEDSLYARAWAGLGDAYSLLGGFGYMAPAEAFGQARMSADRAIALDSTLADAHTALGFVNLFYDRDWLGAKNSLETALRLDPAYGEARLFYAWYLTAMNATGAAVDSLRSAVRDEPVSLILNLRLASMLILANRLDDAKVQLNHTLELSNAYPLAYLDLAKVATLQGDYALALKHLEKVPSMVASYGSGVRGAAFARAGRGAEARAEAVRLSEATGASQSPLGAAQTYTALGDRDRAFQALEKAYELRDWALFFVRADPFLVPLHGDPRWTAFVARMGFP